MQTYLSVYFFEKVQTLIETTKEVIGRVNYNFEITVFKLKNLITGDKISGLAFGKIIIDADEIEGLVKSLNVMKEAVGTARPQYTLINYRSRTGLEIGAYFDLDQGSQFATKEKKWMYYIKSTQDDRQISLQQADFLALCGYVEVAKNKL